MDIQVDLRSDCPSSEIYFKQVNLQKTKQGQTEIKIDIKKLNSKNKRFIQLIQEPYVYNNTPKLVPTSCKTYYPKGNARVAIYTDLKTNAWLIETLCSKDVITIQTKINNRSTIICSCYFDITAKPTISPELERIMQYVSDNGLAIIIGADTNAHSTSFGPDNNKRGEDLDEFIATHGLKIENNGQTPTYESRNTGTCIDITLTKGLSVSVNNWRVDQNYNGSDHNTILFSTKTQFEKVEPTWLYNKADWEGFASAMELKTLIFPDNITCKDLETVLNQFYKFIKQAMSKFIPKSKGKVLDLNNPWWNNNLKQQRKQLTKMYRKKMKFPTAGNQAKYRELFATYSKTCEKEQKINFNDYAECINSIEAMNKFRKITEIKANKKIGTLEREDGTITKPGTDTLNHLVETHFPNATEIQDTQYNEDTTTLRFLLEWNPSWITYERMEKALAGFHNKKSPGTDGLKPIVLKHLPNNIKSQLLTLYKGIIKLKFTPTIWKGSNLIFIPKPGKITYKKPKSWRPISLSNYLVKTLEKLCVWRMDEALLDNPIHTRQHGFRSDRNTETALSSAVNYIEKHIFNDKIVIGVFLDIQAAFDTIKPQAIVDALIKHGGDPEMVNWYYEYITHRNIFTEINGSKISKTIKVGFPQGGVCSAKFWIIAFNEAINIINTHGTFGNGFADDCLTMIGGTNVHQMMSRLQKVTAELENWGLNQGLKFNPSKTEVLIFTRKNRNKMELPNRLKVGGLEVNFSDCAKYLGVTIDDKLNWNHHINNITAKNKRYLFALGTKTKIYKMGLHSYR